MIHLNLGSILIEIGDLESAEISILKALQIEPNYPDAHFTLGNVFSETGRLDQAISSYEKAISIDKNHKLAISGLGKALMRQGKSLDGLNKIRESEGYILFDANISSVEFIS